ncbi:glycosyltransferase family 2 protein [candidate division KSB1 bacterium]
MQYFPKVSIGLVLYKDEKYLRTCIKSLMEQDYPNIEFLIRDQSPNREAYEYIRNELYGEFQQLKIESGPNLWHSGGHNALIRRMTGDYYIVCSSDMWYPSDFVSRAIETLEEPGNRHYGSATCKLMVWDFSPDNPDPELASGDSGPGQKTNVIDSCGIGITPSHHFYDMGQGEEDKGQYDRKRNIFGPSGALSIFRKTALDDIAYKNTSEKLEYYDSLLHYKNDVDLAYRLQWAGHRSLFIPDVKIWHDRKATNLYTSPVLAHRILKARDDKSQFIKENSFFGQQIVMKKNYNNDFSLPVRLKSAFYRMGRLGYATLFERYLLKQFGIIKEFENEIMEKQQKIKFRMPSSRIEKLMK